MDSLNANAQFELSQGEPAGAIPPPESRCRCPKQQIARPFIEATSKPTPQHAGGLSACFHLAGTAAMTVAGLLEIMKSSVGGVTALEWMVLVLFVLLFAWIGLLVHCPRWPGSSYCCSGEDPLGIDRSTASFALQQGMDAVTTYNEDPNRITARLRAMHESVEESARARNHWFVLSDRRTRRSGSRKKNVSSGSAADSARATSTIVTGWKTRRANPANIQTGSSASERPTII